MSRQRSARSLAAISPSGGPLRWLLAVLTSRAPLEMAWSCPLCVQFPDGSTVWGCGPVWLFVIRSYQVKGGPWQGTLELEREGPEPMNLCLQHSSAIGALDHKRSLDDGMLVVYLLDLVLIGDHG